MSAEWGRAIWIILLRHIAVADITAAAVLSTTETAAAAAALQTLESVLTI